ncbi:ABC transporter permease [Streptomyces malaysiensis]|uniref:ABC transporter permease n=1 Tax=Streptomyces malaysiensis TaxID=92644 RepID=UPI000AD5BD77|nr:MULTISPECIES: ABC transporter permease [Streptomyces]ATL86514.1 putative ABC transporter permease protein [Streptomyces malaysiensis]AUA10233.1 Glutathione transport system permease protein GsiD [Streptomyces sp. M56]MCM3810714.1 ABC transporter permease [Streptomyces sp. DR7-3]MYX55367.1 ABC transporter permease subunit [Streptomyces sp. SID8382]QDL69926.1 ABC transporter permease [Streptomyces malaysiensis]
MTTVTAGALIPVRIRARRPVPMMIAGGFLALVVVAAVCAPLIAPHAPDAVDLSASLAGTTSQHPLGTDASGQDLLSRVLYGARSSLLAPLALLALAALLGVTIGTVAAWRGGWVDTLLSRVTDVMYAFPGLLFVVLVIAVFGDGLTTSIIALGLAYAPTIARYTRSLALAERSKPYIDAYRVQGMSGARICVRHLVPNLAGAIVGYLVVLFGEGLMSLATLSYLGFGAGSPSIDWGLMVQEGQDAVVQGALLPALVPGAAIAAVVVAFNIVGVRVSDRLGKGR